MSSSSVSQTEVKVPFTFQELMSYVTNEDGKKLEKFLRDNPDLFRVVHFGGDPNNSGKIRINSKPFNSLMERLTNGFDALIQREKDNGTIEGYDNPHDIGRDLFDADASHKAMDSNEVFLYLHGKKTSDATSATFDIIDRGCGMDSYSMKKTVLNSHSGTKASDPCFIGRFGQGGSTTFNFCDLTMLVSRKQGSSTVNVAFVLLIEPGDFNPVTGMIQERSGTWVTYLDPNTERPFEFTDLSYNEVINEKYIVETLDKNGEVKKKTEYLHGVQISEFLPGTLVRHFSYRLDPNDLHLYGKATSQKTSLYTTANTRFVYPAIPFALSDRREGVKGTQIEFRIKGNLRTIRDKMAALKAEKPSDLVYGNTAQILLKDAHAGRVQVEWYVFSKEACDNGKNYFYVSGRDSERGCGCFAMSGQMVAPVPNSMIRDLGFTFLDESVAIYITLDSLSDRIKDRILTSTRESIDELFKKEVLEHVAEQLKSDEQLHRIHAERKAQMSQPKAEQIKVSEKIKDLFKSFFKAKDDDGDTAVKKVRKPRTPKEVEEIELLDTPTLFEIVGENPKTLVAGQTFRLNIKTNAKVDLISKETVLFQGDRTVLDFTEYSMSYRNGHLIVSGLKVRENITIDELQTLHVMLKVPNDPMPLMDELHYTVIEKAPEKRRNRTPNAQAPEFHVQWVTEDEESLMLRLGFATEEGGSFTILRDKVSTLVKDADGSYTCYILQPSTFVEKALESIESDARTLRNYEKYKSAFLEDYYSFKIAYASMEYALRNNGPLDRLSGPDEDLTPYEFAMTTVASLITHDWCENFVKICKM